MEEEIRSIPAYPGYSVSDLGRVFGLLGPLKLHKINSGYFGCSLRRGSEKLTTTVQRLVLTAFVGDPPSSEHHANHINGIKTDNRPANLEWVTRSENLRHAIDVLGKRFGPEPKERPSAPAPGYEHIRLQISGPGWAHDVLCTVPEDRCGRSVRSDQYRVTIDGREWSACTGISETLAHLRQYVIPRTITRQQRNKGASAMAGMQQGYSARDDADAAAC